MSNKRLWIQLLGDVFNFDTTSMTDDDEFAIISEKEEDSRVVFHEDYVVSY